MAKEKKKNPDISSVTVIMGALNHLKLKRLKLKYSEEGLDFGLSDVGAEMFVRFLEDESFQRDILKRLQAANKI